MEKSSETISHMFNTIAKTYDFLNRVLSLGIDIYWRKKIRKFIPLHTNMKLLDLATGTGDIVFDVLKYSNKFYLKNDTWLFKEIIGIDIAESMLEIARKKQKKHKNSEVISFTKKDATHLDYKARYFNIVTVAFGIRNMENIEKVFNEVYKVIDYNGYFMILELSLPSNAMLKSLYLFYFRYVLPTIAGIISGSSKSYSYLNQSVEGFYKPSKVKSLLTKAGFSQVKTVKMNFGICILYIAHKTL